MPTSPTYNSKGDAVDSEGIWLWVVLVVLLAVMVWEAMLPPLTCAYGC